MPTETALSLFGVCHARLIFFLGVIFRPAVRTRPKVVTGTRVRCKVDESRATDLKAGAGAAHTAVSRRDNYSLPSGFTILDTDYVKVALNEAYVNNSVRYSGHTKWELLHGVTEFYLDVDKSIQHYADMDVTVKAPWSTSWTWSPATLSYSVIEVPGIISLGPSAGISFGGSISADVAVAITGDFTSKIPHGTTHVDLVNWGSSCE